MEYSVLIVLALNSVLTKASQNIVDLTHPFKVNETIYFDRSKQFRMENEVRGFRDIEGGDRFWYENEEFATPTHGGTHMDAPCHFSKGSWTVDQIPVERLMAPACIVDVTRQASENRDYQLSRQDLVEYERVHGQIPHGALVILNSGWSLKWQNKTEYLGNQNGDPDKLSFPGFSAEAAEWLLTSRVVYGLGVDTPSIDHGQSKDFPVHRAMLGENIYGMENLANLERVPASGARIIALPMKMYGGSGGPLRAVAVWDTEESIELNLYLIVVLTGVLMVGTALLVRFFGIWDF